MAVVLASATTAELADKCGDDTSSTSKVSATATDVEYLALHPSSDCGNTPFLITATAVCSANVAAGCSYYTPQGFSGSGASAAPADSFSDVGCSDDWASTVDTMFGGEPYLRIDFFSDGCAKFAGSTVALADRECHGYAGVDAAGYTVASSILTSINDDGSATMAYYYGSDCSGGALAKTTITAELLSSSTCSANGTVAYTNAADSGSSSSSTEEEEAAPNGEDPDTAGESTADDSAGLSTGAVIGIVVGVVAFIAIIAAFAMWRRRRSSRDEYREPMQ